MPEQRLQLTVLAQAITDLTDRYYFVGAARWIFEQRDRKDPWSFQGTCGSLGLDPNYLCAKLTGFRYARPDSPSTTDHFPSQPIAAQDTARIDRDFPAGIPGAGQTGEGVPLGTLA